MYEWSDLRVFLAVARGGSTLAASRVLGVNQTTVARRVAALEAALKTMLFDRLQSGYRLTEIGELVRASAERVEAEAESLARVVVQQGRQLAGVIRITTNEALANQFVTPWMGEFAEIYPDIRLQMIVEDRRLDLARGEADVALRAGSRPTDGSLVIRRLSTLTWSVYCSRSYANRRGRPSAAEELNDHAIISGDGAVAHLPGMHWLAEKAPTATVVAHSNSMTNLLATVKAGLGVTTLPSTVGDAEPDLLRCLPSVPELDSELFLVTRGEIKDLPRVRAFTEFLAARVTAVRHRLAARA